MVAPYIGAAPEPFPDDDTADLKEILKEVKQGCKSHEKRITEAQELTDFYDGNSEKFIPPRPSEDNVSWLTRPKRVSLITREAVSHLTSHLYKPGPRYRRIVGEGREDIDAWYNQVVNDVHMNGVMQHADTLATLHGLCLIGIYPTGKPRRPISYHLFPRQDFCYWASPDDPRVATAVCTITRFGDQTRYRLWTKTHYYTFWRKSAWGYVSGGMTVARFDPEASGAHEYGTLPFCFISNSLPTTELETKGLGYLLRKINIALNDDKSRLASWVHLYGRPIGMVSGVSPEWRPKIVDGGFIVLTVRHDSTEDAPVIPDMRYLESNLNISEVRQYIVSEANQFLAEIGVPISIATPSGSDSGNALNAPSGKAIEANDSDLITFAKQRQPLFGIHESHLAETICRVGGSPKGNMEQSFAVRLLEVADDMKLRVSWPEPRIDMPGQERDMADQWMLDNGLTDQIEILMHRDGLTEDEAVDAFRKVQVRRQQIAVITAAVSVEGAYVDEDGNRTDLASETPPEVPMDEADDEDDGEVVGDMGLESDNKPSDSTAADTSVTPDVRVTSVVTPSTPIASLDVAAATGGWSASGTEQ